MTGDASGASAAGAAGRAAIRIVIADDHAVVRAGLRALLDAEPDLAVVAECGDVREAQRLVADHAPDVLVLDVSLGGRSSIPAIPALRAAAPAVRVVMLTVQDDPASAREALLSGASAYVLKQAAEDELIHAIRLAAAGQTYVAAAVAEPAPAPGAPVDLSPREVEVLRLLALGHTNSEIAGQLFLSVRTVETHRAHIQQKTGCRSRAELATYARAHGVV